MGRKMFRKLCLVAMVSMMCAMCTVYVTYFHHGPASEVLQANAVRHVARRTLASNSTQDEDAQMAAYQLGKWEAWVDANGYVPIGEVYDKCEHDEHQLNLGRVVLLPDKKKGGLLAKLFINATLGQDVTSGGIQIDIKYNKHDLYGSRWDLCTAEDRELEVQNKILKCPIRAGRMRVAKPFKIPSFLPKGSYNLGIQIFNQDEAMVFCTKIEFAL